MTEKQLEQQIVQMSSRISRLVDKMSDLQRNMEVMGERVQSDMKLLAERMEKINKRGRRG